MEGEEGEDDEGDDATTSEKKKKKNKASRSTGQHRAARDAADVLLRGSALVAPGSSAVQARAARSEQYERTSSAVSRWQT